jgi:hypothetical protein
LSIIQGHSLKKTILCEIADQQHQTCVDEYSSNKRKAAKLSSQKDKLSLSDKARKEDNTYARDKLREIIGNEAGWIYSIMINNKVLCLGNVLSNEIPTNGQVPMAIFDKKSV